MGRRGPFSRNGLAYSVREGHKCFLVLPLTQVGKGSKMEKGGM